MDFLTKQQRSALMSKVRGKNTKIELSLFESLRNCGLSFDTHSRALPGRPDVVFSDCRLVVFVDGDFWHGRNFGEWCEKLNSFWRAKIETNIKRDRRVNRRLRAEGWSVLHLWGKDILRNPERCLSRILTARTGNVNKCRELKRP
jgi:DNA mismatch endonuclease, patch repair protein